MTVLGTVPGSALGFILPHEHVRIDNSVHHVPFEGLDAHASLDASLIGPLRVRPHAVIANLVLDDDEAVTDELRHVRAIGGTTLVDLTPRGMGRDPAYLAGVARRTGLHVISGTGFYVARAHADLVSGRSIDELASVMAADLSADVHPAGVIGEIGISLEPHPDEWRVLDAALSVQARTGAPIWVHLTTLAPMREVLERLAAVAPEPGRIVLCHADYDLRDLALHREALAMGLVVEMDLFGFPAWNRRNFVHAPDDTLRIERLLQLAADGYDRQLLMSQDVCMKLQLRRYGGFGYGHLIDHVFELFTTLGGSPDLWHRLTHSNPARLLAWHPATMRQQGEPSSISP
jgi:phosphotriesterase-related protein